MTALLSLFTNNLLPIFLTAGAGYLLSRYTELDARTLSRTIFYLFSPCLVFNVLTANQLEGGDSLRITTYAVVFTLLIGVITLLIGLALKLERRILVAVLITSMFTNAGNFGLSLNNFAFGDDAFAYASLYFVMSGMMIYTLGVLIASMGNAGIKQAILGLLRLPTVYAVILALIFNNLGWGLPVPVERSVTLLGQAAIPSMLVLLGMQLKYADLSANKLPLLLANGMRILVAPLLAIGLSVIFGLAGPARQAGITEAAMPTAVMTTVLATEFDIHPAFVTTVVTTTTLLSMVTLTPLLAFLGG
ncbi:AEC family transporter [Chloroflexota bacterium]